MEQIIFDRAALISALKWVMNGTINSKSYVTPIIQFLKTDKGIGITVTALEIKKVTWLDSVSGELSNNFGMDLSDLKKLISWLGFSHLGNFVHIYLDDDKFACTYPNGFKILLPLSIESTEDEDDKENEGEYTYLDTIDILDLQKMAMFCSEDTLRPVMTGIYIDNKKYVSTDAHRLVYRRNNTCTQGDEYSCILPSNIIKSLDQSKSGELWVKDGGFAMIKTQKGEVYFKLISDSHMDAKDIYPDADAIIPNDNLIAYNITFDLRSLIENIKMLQISVPNTQSISLSIGADGVITFMSEDLDYMSSVEIVEPKANISDLPTDDVIIGFNCGLFLSLLLYIKNNNPKLDEIVLGIVMPSRPIIIKGAENETIIIMPVMLNL